MRAKKILTDKQIIAAMKAIEERLAWHIVSIKQPYHMKCLGLPLRTD